MTCYRNHRAHLTIKYFLRSSTRNNPQSLYRPLPIRLPIRRHARLQTPRHPRLPPGQRPALQALPNPRLTLRTLIPRRRGKRILSRLHQGQHGRWVAQACELRLQGRDAARVRGDVGREHHGAGALARLAGRGEVVDVVLEVSGLEGHPGDQGRLFGGGSDGVLRKARDHGADCFGSCCAFTSRRGIVARAGGRGDGDELGCWVAEEEAGWEGGGEGCQGEGQEYWRQHGGEWDLIVGSWDWGVCICWEDKAVIQSFPSGLDCFENGLE